MVPLHLGSGLREPELRRTRMGVPADGFRPRITTFTPMTPRKDLWEYEERLLYPCGRPQRESDTESQDGYEKAFAEDKREPPEIRVDKGSSYV